jgi:hypothetical protein
MTERTPSRKFKTCRKYPNNPKAFPVHSLVIRLAHSRHVVGERSTPVASFVSPLQLFAFLSPALHQQNMFVHASVDIICLCRWASKDKARRKMLKELICCGCAICGINATQIIMLPRQRATEFAGVSLSGVKFVKLCAQL